jgi:hypothetical protein
VKSLLLLWMNWMQKAAKQMGKIGSAVRAVNASKGAFALLGMALLFGAILRFSGVNWGMPDRVDLHPDERMYVIEPALKIAPGALDPGFLNYPNFIHYSIAAVLGVLRSFGLETTTPLAHQVGRSILAGYGTLTIGLAWLLAGRLGARRKGQALAAVWVAILPLHVWESHIAVTDVMMTFWIMAVLLGALRIARGADDLRWWVPVLSGVALGCAVGSKYTAALSSVALLMGMIYARMPWRRFLLVGIAIGVSALLACFVVTPYSFLRFGDLLEAMAFEHEHVRGHHLGFSTTAPGWQYHKYVYQLCAAWPFSFGIALYVSVGLGVLWMLWRLSYARSIPLVLAGLLYFVMGGWTYTPIRYYMPIIVIGAICAGVWHGALLDGAKRARRAGMVLVLVTLAYTTWFCVETNARYGDDTREQAARWLRTYNGEPMHVAALGSGAYLGHFKGSDVVTFKVHPEGNAGRLYNEDFDLIQISSLHYLRWLRHGRPDFYGTVYGRIRDNDANLRLVKRFEDDFPNKRFYGVLDPMFTCLFVSPTLEFYASSTGADRFGSMGDAAEVSAAESP